jgi:hypothetical protein
MYYPQTYHHIQEIQKYNIQDYRPRYTTYSFRNLELMANTCIEWNNSKKQFEKCVKSNACASNVAMHFHKPMNRKRASYKPTIRRENEVDMERWPVQDRLVNEGMGQTCMMLGYSIVTFFLVSRGARFERLKWSMMQKGVWECALTGRDGWNSIV